MQAWGFIYFMYRAVYTEFSKLYIVIIITLTLSNLQQSRRECMVKTQYHFLLNGENMTHRDTYAAHISTEYHW